MIDTVRYADRTVRVDSVRTADDPVQLRRLVRYQAGLSELAAA